MNLQKRRTLIEATNGGIFSASFVKKNGELRRMNCRLKVQKFLQGGKSTTAHKENLVTVYDLKSKGYRSINLQTLISVKFNGSEVAV